MEKNIKIAITGGIGSGKSTVCDLIQSMGYTVISCDKITAELYENAKVLRGIKKLFPTAVKGLFKLKAQKAEIAKIIFSDKQKYDQLNDFIMPMIKEILFDRLNMHSGIVFAEVPLLYEANLKDEFDQVIVVTRDKEKRIKSVMERSLLTDTQVLLRMNMQINYDDINFSNEKIIENNGDLLNLKEKTVNLLNTLKKEYNL